MKRLDPIIKVVISMILLWPSSSAVLAQNNSQYLVDSVLLKLAVMPTDTSKVDSLSRIAYLMHLHDPIAGIEFSRIALQLADSLDYQRGMARSESTWGLNYYSLTEFPKAVEHTLKALEMRNFIAERKARKLEAGLPYFEVRIGVHTGPVVAGIVGVKKFSYDIWGDTVNTANRMESSSSVGQVNISQATYALIKDDTSFVFKHRGKIEAKGKGELEMYFVDLKSNTG